MTEALIFGFVAFLLATVFTNMLLKYLDPFITSSREKRAKKDKPDR